jgi:hypothetical protein
VRCSLVMANDCCLRQCTTRLFMCKPVLSPYVFPTAKRESKANPCPRKRYDLSKPGFSVVLQRVCHPHQAHDVLVFGHFYPP